MGHVLTCGIAAAILTLTACSSGPTRYEQTSDIRGADSTPYRPDPFYDGGVFDRETRTNQWPLTR